MKSHSLFLSCSFSTFVHHAIPNIRPKSGMECEQKVINLINHINPHRIEIDYEMANKYREKAGKGKKNTLNVYTLYRINGNLHCRKNIAQFFSQFTMSMHTA